MYLMPRLSTSYARLLAEDYAGHEVSEVRKLSDKRTGEHLMNTEFAATGGIRVNDQILRDLAHKIRQVAKQYGYPETRTLQGQRQFDFYCAQEIDKFEIIPAEAARKQVWQYVTCALVPDVVCWRFGKTDSSKVRPPVSDLNRFLGGIRNTIGRLYWRAKLLKDPGHDEPYRFLNFSHPDGLSEDNMVAITERPVLSGYDDVCRQIALLFNEYRDLVTELDDNSEQRFFRQTMKRVTRRAAFLSFASLSQEELAETLRNCFISTAQSMGAKTAAVKASPTFESIYDALPANLHRYIEESIDAQRDTPLAELQQDVQEFAKTMHIESRRVPTIDTELVEKLADRLVELLKHMEESDNSEAIEAVRGAAGYFMSHRDQIRFFEVGGFEDDREIINAAARFVDRKDLVIPWSTGFPEGSTGDKLDLPHTVRGSFERLVADATLQSENELAEKLRNYLAFLNAEASTQEHQRLKLTEKVARYYFKLIDYLEQQETVERYRRVLQAGIDHFVARKDIHAGFQDGDRQEDITLYNAIAEYLGRSDVIIEPGSPENSRPALEHA